MRRVLACLVLAMLSLAVPTAYAGEPVEVISHRGASRVFPENTIWAINAAVDAGADVVEVDVRLTADRQLVLLHDTSLARTTDVEERFPDRAPWAVHTFTLEEIATLDAGTWKDPFFVGERVPTLAQALDATRGRATLLVDMKAPRTDVHMEVLVARELTTDGTPTGPVDPADSVVVQSMDDLSVARFAVLQPEVEVGLVTSAAPTTSDLDTYAHFADRVSVPRAAVETGLIDAVQQRGMEIFPYTVNDRPTMRTLLSWGVDGIVTDIPERLRGVRDGTQ